MFDDLSGSVSLSWVGDSTGVSIFWGYEFSLAGGWRFEELEHWMLLLSETASSLSHRNACLQDRLAGSCGGFGFASELETSVTTFFHSRKIDTFWVPGGCLAPRWAGRRKRKESAMCWDGSLTRLGENPCVEAENCTLPILAFSLQVVLFLCPFPQLLLQDCGARGLSVVQLHLLSLPYHEGNAARAGDGRVVRQWLFPSSYARSGSPSRRLCWGWCMGLRLWIRAWCCLALWSCPAPAHALRRSSGVCTIALRHRAAVSGA